MKRITAALACVMFTAVTAHAQTCFVSSGTTTAARFCNAARETAELTQRSVGIAFVAGNPIAGASSTLGMRIGRIPRITFAVRATGVFVDLPNVQSMSSTGSNKGLVRTLNADIAVGIFSGWGLAPTIGGFGSLDVLASIGKSSLLGEFSQSPASWAVGARLGILRESFTAPGVSVTATYRRIGDIRYGMVPTATSTTPDIFLHDNSATSVRAIVGKRLFVVGANAGVGFDRFESDIDVPSRNSISFAPSGQRNVGHTRHTTFVDLTWTMLVLNFVAEGGIQRGGDEFTDPLPSGMTSKTQKNGLYAGVAVRLAL